MAMLQDDGTVSKRWITERDEDVRGPQTNELRCSHQGMDNQVRPKAVPFDDPVSKSKMMWPGDRSQGAEGFDVIRCRCTAMSGDDTARSIDRTEYWLKRDALLTDDERAIKGEMRRHLSKMEDRILERLDKKMKEAS